MCFARISKLLSNKFFITPDFALHCDDLLGLDFLASHQKNIFPLHYAVSSEETLYPTMDCTSPLLNPNHSSVAAMQSVPFFSTDMQSTAQQSTAEVTQTVPTGSHLPELDVLKRST